MEGYIYNFIRRLEELVLLQEKSVNIILQAKSVKALLRGVHARIPFLFGYL
jgi:hypothetical protein